MYKSWSLILTGVGCEITSATPFANPSFLALEPTLLGISPIYIHSLQKSLSFKDSITSGATYSLHCISCFGQPFLHVVYAIQTIKLC